MTINDNCDILSKQNVRSNIFKIAIPALVELFLVHLCGMVDLTMVSKINDWSIAAVGYSDQPRFIALTIFTAMSIGTTALISRYKGCEKNNKINNIMKQSVLISFILSLVLIFVGYIFAEYIFIFLKVPAEVLDDTKSYFQIWMLGLLFNAMTISITSSLRGIGKTTGPLIYNLTSNITNIILNYLLIFGNFNFPKLGIQGAAFATVISQIISFFMAIYILNKYEKYFKFRFINILSADIFVIKKILKLSLPSMFEQLVMRVGMLLYMITVYHLGKDVTTAHKIAGSILTFSYLNGQCFSIACTSLLGQSLGKKRVDFAKLYTKECIKFSNIISFLLCLLFILFSQKIMSIFTSNEIVMNLGTKVLLVVAILQPIQSSQLVLNGALRGAGDMFFVSIITFVGILFFRPFSSYLLVTKLQLGLMGAWISMSIDQAIRFIFAYFRFKSEKWANIQI